MNSPSKISLKLLKEDNYTNDEIQIIKKFTKHKQTFSSLYEDHIEALPYRQRINQFKIPIHNGQRKLFLSSLLFLIKYSDMSNLVVYAGAAPGTNIVMLAKLYPHLRFHLYDPRPFDVRLENLKNVELFQSYFTNKIAKSYEQKNIILWSDIRTGTVEDDDFEDQIMENNKMQQKWHDLSKPVMGMYKFRLPYNDPDKESDENDKVEHMGGQIWLQQWAPTTSTETRLIVKRKYKNIPYDSRLYENRLYYFNLIDRQWANYELHSNIQLMNVKCNCYDCTCEKMILFMYLETISKNTPKNVRKLSECLTNYVGSIKHLHHGYVDYPIWEKYEITLKLFKEKVLKERDNKIKIRKIHYDSNATKLIKEH
jgi:hypothetical protein